LDLSTSPSIHEDYAFRKILVALDLTEQPHRVLKLASLLTTAFNSELLVASVVLLETSVEGDEADGKPVNDKETEMRRALINLINQELGQNAAASKVDVKILHGDPASRITQYAEYENCDLIIVGSSSDSAIKKAFMGSVSGSVIQKSKIPVLVVKYQNKK
jgi:nucleotide-binding universal stress UspA family protein